MQLKRTKQCEKCPWRKDVDPLDIPGGYTVEKHHKLASIITAPGDMGTIFAPTMQVMACHETTGGDEAHCLGWLMQQLGPGNNLGLRMSMRNCENIGDVELVGDQHETLEDTFPEE